MKKTFNDYKLEPSIIKALDMLGYHTATPVQEQVIPALLKGRDVIVKSETGSGKTAAFSIPVIDRVDWDENSPQVLVLTPTRELAQQVQEEMFNIGRFKRMKVVSVYGKSPIKSQIKALKTKTHIVTGTPGRVFDHIQRGTLDLSKIKYLVLDEADEMLNMGFVEQIEAIMDCLPKNYIVTMLSATYPEGLSRISGEYMTNPIVVEIENETVHNRIEQVRYNVAKPQKIDLLMDLMIIENPDSCIIFCNTRAEVDFVHQNLHKAAYPCQKIHGGMEQDDRTRVMKNFKKGYYRYLVATDVAARGIDVDDISLVVNYDMPEEAEVYVHRIGRTGRQDKTGKAISFSRANDCRLLKAVLDTIEDTIVLNDKPSQASVEAARVEFDLKISQHPELRIQKSHKMDQEILKLHINAGKKTKMRPGDIVGAVCSIEGVTGEDIGNIDVIDVSSFVEILNNKGEMVFKALQTTPIKARIRNVSRANS